MHLCWTLHWHLTLTLNLTVCLFCMFHFGHISMEADFFNIYIYKASLLIFILTKICVLLYLVADFQNFRFLALTKNIVCPIQLWDSSRIETCTVLDSHPSNGGSVELIARACPITHPGKSIQESGR